MGAHDVDFRFRGNATSATRASKDTERGLQGVERQAKQTATSVSSSMDKMNRGVTSSAGKMASSLGTIGKRAALGLGFVGTAAAGLAAGMGFNFLKIEQQAKIAFTTMLGDGGKARKFLDDLAKFAKSTPFEFPELIRTSQKLLAMGFAAEEVVPSLTAIGNAVSALGGSPEQLDRVTIALGQMQLKGRAQAEEMLQLIEAGVNGWGYLAKAMNTTVAKAQDAVTKRQVEGRFAVKAILAGMEGDFAGSMEKQSRTFAGLWSTIKDTVAQASATALRPFFDLMTRGMQRFVDFSNSPQFTEGVERLGRWVRDVVVPAFVKLGDWLVDHRGEIAAAFERAWKMAAGFADALGDVLAAFKPLLDALGGFEEAGKLAFGVLMAGRVAALMGMLGFAPGGQPLQGKGLRGALAKLAGRAWVIPIALAVSMQGDSSATGILTTIGGGAAAGFAIGGPAGAIVGAGAGALIAGLKSGKANQAKNRAAWNQMSYYDQMTLLQGLGRSGMDMFFGKGWKLKPTPQSAGATNRPEEGSTSALPTLQAPMTWANPGQGHAGGQTDGLPLGKTQGPIDIMAKAGTPVGAPEAGVVKRYDPKGAQGGGSMHFLADSGTMYWLGHISNGRPPGTRVRKGEIIAYISGDHANPHLHIDRKEAGSKVDVPTGTTGIDPGVYTPMGGDSTAESDAEKDAIDPGERSAASRGLKVIAKRLGAILSPRLEAMLRKRAAQIRKAIASAATGTELDAAEARLAKLRDDFQAALDLNPVQRALSRSAKKIGDALARMPAELQTRLRPQLAEINRLLEKGLISEEQADRLKARLDKINAAIAERIDKAKQIVEDKRGGVADAFGSVMDKALRIFDARTSKLLRDARAKVEAFGFEIGADEETPTERLLRERRAAREDADRARAIDEARAKVGSAETPEERAEAERELNRLLLDEEERQLEKQAEAERKAADEALEKERERIEDERAATRERFEARLRETIAGWQKENMTAEQAMTELNALMAEFGVDFQSAGALIGAAFAEGFREAIADLQAAVQELVGAINQVAGLTGGKKVSAGKGGAKGTSTPYTPTPPAGKPILEGFAKGGLFVGRRIAGIQTALDSRLAPVRPGELIAAPEVMERIAAIAAGGGGGNVTVIVKDAMFLTGDRAAAAELARTLAPEIERALDMSVSVS